MDFDDLDASDAQDRDDPSDFIRCRESFMVLPKPRRAGGYVSKIVPRLLSVLNSDVLGCILSPEDNED